MTYTCEICEAPFDAGNDAWVICPACAHTDPALAESVGWRMQSFDSRELAAIVANGIDVVAAARAELAARGRDDAGEFVGWRH